MSGDIRPQSSQLAEPLWTEARAKRATLVKECKKLRQEQHKQARVIERGMEVILQNRDNSKDPWKKVQEMRFVERMCELAPSSVVVQYSNVTFIFLVLCMIIIALWLKKLVGDIFLRIKYVFFVPKRQYARRATVVRSTTRERPAC